MLHDGIVTNVAIQVGEPAFASLRGRFPNTAVLFSPSDRVMVGLTWHFPEFVVDHVEASCASSPPLPTWPPLKIVLFGKGQEKKTRRVCLGLYNHSLWQDTRKSYGLWQDEGLAVFQLETMSCR